MPDAEFWPYFAAKVAAYHRRQRLRSWASEQWATTTNPHIIEWLDPTGDEAVLRALDP